jgi:hypothetical protein
MVTDLLSGHLTIGRVVVAACGLMLSVAAQAQIYDKPAQFFLDPD